MTKYQQPEWLDAGYYGSEIDKALRIAEFYQWQHRVHPDRPAVLQVKGTNWDCARIAYETVQFYLPQIDRLGKGGAPGYHALIAVPRSAVAEPDDSPIGLNQFLQDLTELTKRTGIVVGYGVPAFCYRPGLEDLKAMLLPVEGGLAWNAETQMYQLADR